MVTTPQHERFLCSDTELHSHSRVAREQAHDLAYRAVIPSPLAYAAMGRPIQHAEQDDLPPEDFAAIGHPASIQLELECAKRRHLSVQPTISLSARPSIRRFVHLPVRPCVRLPVRPLVIQKSIQYQCSIEGIPQFHVWIS